MILDGKELVVTFAGFADSMALKEAIANALRKNGTKFDLSSIDVKGIDFDNIEKTELGDVGWVFEHILTLATDRTIRTHLFKCAERVAFGEKRDKINESFFNTEENVKYYYPIMMEVLKVNILPFFGLASSLFSKLEGLKDKFLKSE